MSILKRKHLKSIFSWHDTNMCVIYIHINILLIDSKFKLIYYTPYSIYKIIYYSLLRLIFIKAILGCVSCVRINKCLWSLGGLFCIYVYEYMCV